VEKGVTARTASSARLGPDPVVERRLCAPSRWRTSWSIDGARRASRPESSTTLRQRRRIDAALTAPAGKRDRPRLSRGAPRADQACRLLLAALAIVAERPATRAAIVGDGPATGPRTPAARLGLADCVFAGRQEQVADGSAARVFVLVAVEGLPLSASRR
jgi:hypothetical protein